jgi:hypothetical protein
MGYRLPRVNIALAKEIRCEVVVNAVFDNILQMPKLQTPKRIYIAALCL